MNNQWTHDWDKRFSEADTPWEDEQPTTTLLETIEENISKNKKLLEIGCGLGTNAKALSQKGYEITACDVSGFLISKLKKQQTENLKFLELDAMSEKLPFENEFDLVYDRGCFHSFYTQEALNRFVCNISKLLKKDGLWISMSGNHDNGEAQTEIETKGLPRLSASSIVESVEPFFELIKLEQCKYGEGVNTNFLGWMGVYKKRKFNSDI